MAKDPAPLGMASKSVPPKEAAVLLTTLAAVVPACVALYELRTPYYLFLLPILILWPVKLWIHGNALNRTQAEFLDDLPKWQDKRFYAALHIRGNHRFGSEPQFGDTHAFKRSEDICFMLNRLNEIGENDKKRLYGHEFFREHIWPLLEFYWLNTCGFVISEQCTDQKKWRNIFPTYRKYRDLFNVHATDAAFAEALLKRELHATDPRHGVW